MKKADITRLAHGWRRLIEKFKDLALGLPCSFIFQMAILTLNFHENNFPMTCNINISLQTSPEIRVLITQTHRIPYVADKLRKTLKLQALLIIFLYFTIPSTNQPPAFWVMLTCGLLHDTLCYQRMGKMLRKKGQLGKIFVFINIWLVSSPLLLTLLFLIPNKTKEKGNSYQRVFPFLPFS